MHRCTGTGKREYYTHPSDSSMEPTTCVGGEGVKMAEKGEDRKMKRINEGRKQVNKKRGNNELNFCKKKP